MRLAPCPLPAAPGCAGGIILFKKVEHFAGKFSFYRVGLTWTSNALEGNSLTESETKVLLEDGLTVGGKPLRDVFEAVNLAKAYEFYVFRIPGSADQ